MYAQAPVRTYSDTYKHSQWMTQPAKLMRFLKKSYILDYVTWFFLTHCNVTPTIFKSPFEFVSFIVSNVRNTMNGTFLHIFRHRSLNERRFFLKFKFNFFLKNQFSHNEIEIEFYFFSVLWIFDGIIFTTSQTESIEY